MNLYTYRAVLDRVVDGDTVDLVVDLGFRTYRRTRFRVARINAPEIRGSERPAGLDAKVYINDLLTMYGKDSITVQSRKTGKYGRWIGEIFIDPGDGNLINVSDTMVENGYAEYRDY